VVLAYWLLDWKGNKLLNPGGGGVEKILLFFFKNHNT